MVNTTMDTTNTEGNHKHRYLPLEIIGGIVLILVAAAIGTWPRKTTTLSTTQQQANRPKDTAVPGSFNNFSGRITAIKDTELDVAFEGFQANGQTFLTTYHVKTDAQTTFVKIQPQNGNNVEEPSSLTDLAVNDTIIAAGGQNLANVSDFTATKISKQP